MKRFFVVLIALFLLGTVVTTAVRPSSSVEARGGVSYEHGIKIQRFGKERLMRTWRITPLVDLKTGKRIGNYAPKSQIKMSAMAYKKGYYYFLRSDMLRQGKYYGILVNRVFRVNTKGKAIVRNHLLPLKNGMPLSNHKTLGQGCTSPRPWHKGMHNEMVKIIQQVELHLNVPIKMTTATRSRAEQTCLWHKLGQDRSRVAPPGTSKHEFGVAIDVEKSTYQRFDKTLRQFGLCTPVAGEPWHYEPCWVRR